MASASTSANGEDISDNIETDQVGGIAQAEDEELRKLAATLEANPYKFSFKSQKVTLAWVKAAVQVSGTKDLPEKEKKRLGHTLKVYIERKLKDYAERFEINKSGINEDQITSEKGNLLQQIFEYKICLPPQDSSKRACQAAGKEKRLKASMFGFTTGGKNDAWKEKKEDEATESDKEQSRMERGDLAGNSRDNPDLEETAEDQNDKKSSKGSGSSSKACLTAGGSPTQEENPRITRFRQKGKLFEKLAIGAEELAGSDTADLEFKREVSEKDRLERAEDRAVRLAKEQQDRDDRIAREKQEREDRIAREIAEREEREKERTFQTNQLAVQSNQLVEIVKTMKEAMIKMMKTK